eukprot:scaffold578_cov243-Pinguiococcus_pyrenoidosus.AAC.10
MQSSQATRASPLLAVELPESHASDATLQISGGLCRSEGQAAEVPTKDTDNAGQTHLAAAHGPA